MSWIEIKGVPVKKQSNEIDKLNLYYNDSPESYYFWDLDYMPLKAGVYVIYDIEGECLYVGSTPRRFNIKSRIVEHISSSSFKDYGHRVYCYLTKRDINDILLLERILIKSLNPKFNNDESEDIISKKGKEYIEKYKGIRDWENWNNSIQKDARRAGVPVSLVNLKSEIEAVYDGLLSNIPSLVKGEVSLSTLYENMKKKLEIAKKNGYSIKFEDFVSLISEVILLEELSDGRVTELVLTNKAFKKYIRNRE